MKWTSLIGIIILNSLWNITADHFVPVWEGENGFAHMNIIIVSALIDDVRMQAGDEIGIFDGERCVGSGKISAPIDQSNYNTFLHLVVSMDDGSGNGYSPGDTIIYRLWDSSAQKEYKAFSVEYLNNISAWSTNGRFTSGATSFVKLACKTQIEQSIALSAGWNLMSFYLVPENKSMENVFKPIITAGIRLKVMDEQGRIFEDWGSFGGWLNQIGDLQTTEGYKVCLDRFATLKLKGHQIELPIRIGLKKGWNIISFPLSEKANIWSVTQQLRDQNALEKIQDEKGRSFEHWSESQGWVNNIGSLFPGEGYLIKVNQDISLEFSDLTLKTDQMTEESISQNPQHFSPGTIGNGVDQMNINILLERDVNLGDEIAAFDRGICVGAAVVSEQNIATGRIGLIASGKSYSDQDGFLRGGNIELRYWDAGGVGEEILQPDFLSSKTTYEQNASTLLQLEPNQQTTAIASAEINTFKVYPNPAKDFITIDLTSFGSTTSTSMQVFDSRGITVKEKILVGLLNLIHLDDLPSGLYFIRIKNMNKEVVQTLHIRK